MFLLSFDVEIAIINFIVFETCECYIIFMNQNTLKRTMTYRLWALEFVSAPMFIIFSYWMRQSGYKRNKERKSDWSSYFNQINALSFRELSTMATLLSFKWISMLAVGVFVCCHNEHIWEKKKWKIRFKRVRYSFCEGKNEHFKVFMLTKFMCFVCAALVVLWLGVVVSHGNCPR